MKKILLNKIAFAGIFTILGSFAFAQNKTALDFYNEGITEQNNENWYLASQHFLEAVNENPSYSDAWFNLARCSYMLGEWNLVLQQLDETEKFSRGEPNVENLRGMTYIALERFADARKIFENVLIKSPNNVDARFGLAELDLFDGKLSGAENQYNEALKRQADNRKALLSLAVVSAQMGKYKNARHFIDSAIGYYSGEAEVHYLAAIIYAMEGNVTATEKQCRIAVELNGDYDKAYELLSKALYAQKKYDEVISICDFRISRNRNLSSAWYLKGHAQYDLNLFDDAINTWAGGLRIVPDDEIMRAALELLVKNYVSLEDERRSEWAQYHVNVAREAKSRFDNSQMIWEYQRALKIQPSNEEARLNYADMLELNGMHELYLEQLLFVKENRDLAEEQTSEKKKSLREVQMEDTIEAYSDLLQDSLSKKWGIQPFFLDKTRWNIGIYYIPSTVQFNHVQGNKIAAEYACDVFSGIASAAVNASAVAVKGFGEAYQHARNNKMDYFVILSQDEGNRDISLNYKFYSGRTGYLLKENTLYGTGNNRHSLVFRRFRNEILERLPITGKIVARNGKILLSDLGRFENVKEGAVFDIVRKGSIETSGTTSGVVYKDDDILGTFTVTTASEEVSEGILSYNGFYDRVNAGDQLVLISLPSSEEENARDFSNGGTNNAVIESAPSADANGESLNKTNEGNLTARDLGIRRTPSFVDIIRSIY